MTTIETQIAARTAKYPHLSEIAVAHAFGRNDAFNGYPSDAAEISHNRVREFYEAGFRSAKSEMRLDADTEWDRD